ncbi:MAG: ABC transporter substrate-binding protein [Desulfarculaceae bacterium]|nr:ABC transporter substrate-binding protein [Desulfarculaceae bacterium]MCF8072698.1 ABC transporter substrate-binding protein [Desulfarculaceae bacterium]MCF8102577.1 ABC transporter substrate-binding protein [Desulfarculaceae bacterium]MCF8116486.1 ABC transporter substrate-binding protein [Desulfarculaceae bacterium]
MMVRGLALAAMVTVLLGGLCATPAAAANGMLKIGVLEEPKSLNLWLATDAWSKRVLSLINEPLFIREPKSNELVPWLAAGKPVYDAGKMTYTVKLKKAKWSDGSDFTAADVIFTGQLINKFRMPRHRSKWSFIERVVAVDKHTVRFELKRPKAIFLSRTLTTPIVQKKQWEKIVASAQGAEKPLTVILRHKLTNPIGTGPFVVSKWQKGVFVFMKANPHFFGRGQTISGHKLGPHIKGIIFKVYGTADAAILALRKGAIDFYWNSIQAGYLEQLKDDKDIKLFVSNKSGLYYLGFNLRKEPFDDVALRRAVATLVSKEFIIKRILQGYGEVLHSMIPPGNSFYYNPDVPKYGYGKSMDERMKLAYNILREAGYTWETPPVNANGEVVRGEGIRLPDGSPMKEFTILTPPADYDPHRAMSGQMIQEWLRAAGMPAVSRPMAFGALIQKVKGQHDFDAFILGYGKLSLDPGYLRAFFHSRYNKPRGYNMSGYESAAYDALSNESNNAMDPKLRQEMIFQMQAMLMAAVPYVPLYNPKVIEGVRIDRFTGWVPMLGGVGNIWSLCQIKAK